MIVRLKTSRESKERLEKLNKILHMSNNAVILRYALSLSLIQEKDIDDDTSIVVNNNSGFEISNVTLFGENETLYRVLMKVYDPNDEKKFVTTTLKHIERGLIILDREYQLAGNKDKFISRMINLIK